MIRGRLSSDLDTRLAQGVGRLVASSTGEPLSPAADRCSFDLLEQRIAGRRRWARRGRATLLVLGVFLAGAGGYWGRARLVTETPDDVLTCTLAGGRAVLPGTLLESAADGNATDIAFSDGTHLRMAPRARGRIVDLDRRGGRVALYEGRADVEVRHRPQGQWLFQAGPFEVHVHGTAFSIAWDTATARFDLRMESGVVSVTGPISGGRIVLRAGETLSVGLLDDPTAAVRRPPMPETAPAPEEAVGAASAKRRQEGPASTPGRARPSKDWRAQLAQGHASAVVSDAQQRGIARVLESSVSEELAALADAARYVGDQDLARRALLAQRRRFPRTSRAAEASFLLGRLEDESAGGGLRAIAWYDRYLAEAPEGTYAAEALGRKMMVLKRAHRGEEAVAIASDYLQRFPTGSYAHAASVLVGRAGPMSDRVPRADPRRDP